MRIGKIIAFLTVISLSFSFLTSCGGKLDKRLDKAEEHFRSNPYSVKIAFDFDASDDEISGIFSQLERNVTTVLFDGTSFKSYNVMSIDTGDTEYTFHTTHTVVNGTVYYNVSYAADGVPVIPNKTYSKLTADQMNTLAHRVTYVGGVTADGFANRTETKIDKKTVSILYTDASAEVNEALRRAMSLLFIGSLERAVAGNVSLELVLEKDLYRYAVIKCDYDVTVNGKAYPVSATIRLDFDFGEEYKVYAPDDALEYTLVDPEDVMGVK